LGSGFSLLCLPSFPQKIGVIRQAVEQISVAVKGVAHLRLGWSKAGLLAQETDDGQGVKRLFCVAQNCEESLN
jgi:hypothetical protein